MGQNKKKQQQSKRRIRLPRLYLVVIILVSIAISAAGIYLVSQQKRVKIYQVKKDLIGQLNHFREYSIKKTSRDLQRLFRQLKAVSQDNPVATLISGIEEMTRTRSYIQYPFLINRSGMLLYPQYKAPVLPIEESPDELYLYRNAKMRIPVQVVPDEAFFSSQFYFSSKAQALYKQGMISEFRDGANNAALKFYQKAVPLNREKAMMPLLYNAIGRVYLKNGQTEMAIRTYMMILKSYGHLLKGDLSFLKIRIQRSLALCARQTGSPAKVTIAYLKLLDAFLERPKHLKEIFVFFKREAIAVLEQNQSGLRLAGKTDTFKQIMTQLRDLPQSELDLSIEQRLRALQKQNTAGIRGQSSLFHELFTGYTRELLFYRFLDKQYDWQKGARTMQVIPVDFDSRKKRVSICLQNIASDTPLYFGFVFRQQEYDKTALLTYMNPLIRHLGLVIRFADQEPDPAYPFSTTFLQFERFFHWNSLVMYSNVKDYVGKRVRTDMRLNYLFMAVLVLTFVLFIFLFYKYVSREAELLKLKSNFVDSVSHTLKTPLTRISLLAENIASDWVRDKEKQKSFLKTIIAESHKMNDMINNMLNFSKIDAGKKHYDLKYDSIQTVVLSVISNYESYIRKLGFQLETEISGAIPNIRIDREAVKLMMINLLQNALKYTGETRYIKVCLEETKDAVLLSIEDRGFGITKKEQNKIFEKYYRTQSKRVRSLEGSGLGLYLVRDAMTAHGGEVLVESQVGKGSTFILVFPKSTGGTVE